MRRRRIGEPPQHVPGQPRDRIVEVAMPERTGIGDRSGRKYRATGLGLEEHHVGMDLLVDHAVGQSVRDTHFLVHQLIGVGVVLRSRYHQRVRRCAQHRIDAVDLQACRTALQDSEVAEDLLRHAIEDESRARIVRGIGAPVVRRMIEPLADEADAGQCLRRAVVASPQTAVFAGEAVIVLAHLGVPRARAVLAAAYLDRAGPHRMIRDAPVEAVAAEIHHASALTHPAVERVHHLQRLVFRMAAGHQHAIRPQQVEPFRMQVIVRDHIVGKTGALQPIDDEQIDAVVPEPPCGSDVGRRPQPR